MPGKLQSLMNRRPSSLVAHRYLSAAALLSLAAASAGAGVLPAFPGAEGFGANATGGRGGAVFRVTNLNASGVGAFLRDVVNRWAVEDVTARGGAWANRRPADLLDGLTPGTPPVDDDGDGMADDWESANGLDPTDPGDHSTVRPSGYTAIEEYVNGLADALVTPSLIFADGFESGDTSAW